MDNNDQRRQERSWNDPPMFSMEQLNNASNTVPLNKRYRYPQQPQQPNQMFQQPQTMGGNQSSNYSANYPQPPSTTPYGGGNYPNSQMMPNQPQQQQYNSYGASGTFSSYPPPWPQNYNYPPQQPNQQYPSTQAYSSAPVSGYTASAPTAVPSTLATFNNNDKLPMPSPYGSSDPVLSSTIVNNPTPAVSAAAAPVGFNYNQSTQPPLPEPSMMMNATRVPGFNYGISQQPPPQQYSRYQ